MREIIFYETEGGQCPVEKFIDSLSAKQAQKVTWVLSLIEELTMTPANYFKKLTNTNGIWEVRVSQGGNIFRLLGFFDGANLIVLNHAFQKKSQKTPSQAIKTAEERKMDYLKRKEKK